MDFVSVRRPSASTPKPTADDSNQAKTGTESTVPAFVRPVRRAPFVDYSSSRGGSDDAHTTRDAVPHTAGLPGVVTIDSSVSSGSPVTGVADVTIPSVGEGTGVLVDGNTLVRTVEEMTEEADEAADSSTDVAADSSAEVSAERIGAFPVSAFDDSYDSYDDGVDVGADSVDVDVEDFDDNDLFDALNDIYDDDSVRESITSRGGVGGGAGGSSTGDGDSDLNVGMENDATAGSDSTGDGTAFTSVRSSGDSVSDTASTSPLNAHTSGGTEEWADESRGVDVHDELMDSLLGGGDEAGDVVVATPTSTRQSSSVPIVGSSSDAVSGDSEGPTAEHGMARGATEKKDAGPALLSSLRQTISTAPTLDPGVVAHHERLAAEDETARARYWDEVKAATEERSAARTKLLDDAGVGEQVKVVKRAPAAPSESSFSRQDVNEVLVDEHGHPVGTASSKALAKGGQAKKTDGRAGSRYRYARPDGKLNGAEMEFFKRAQNAMRGERTGASLESMMRGPMNTAMEHETEAQRRERSLVIAQVLNGKDAMNRNSKLKFSEKDRQTLQFLAAFRYATDAQLAHMFSNSTVTAYNRLHRLREKGLVIDRKIYGARPIWFLTRAGMMVSGMDLPRVTESKITYSMFPHQFTVNNTAANLWGANDNVLNLPEYPAKNQIDAKGNPVFGERLCSELEIQSSLSRLRMGEKAGTFRPELRKKIDLAFAQWERAGGVEFGSSPEMMYGNEFMWSLFPPSTVRLAYHVPDLVVMRDRTPDGKPQSIAVEIEINNKPSDRYEKTLLAYKLDTLIYDKVVWVCKSKGPAQKLEQVAKEVGLWQQGRIDIVPVISDGKVFTGRDLWTL